MSQSKIITVNAADDADSEFSEEFAVALSAPAAAAIASNAAVGTITNRTLLMNTGISGGTCGQCIG